MQKYINAHCHLQNFSDLTDIIQQAKGLGICGFVCNSTSSADWNKVIELGKSYSNIYPCIGIHPWYVDKTSDGDILRMHELLKSDSRIMVGEIGLDKLHPDMKTQEDIFIKQLILAAEFNRSAHIHCVGAWDRILRILKSRKLNGLPIMLMHGFSGSKEILTRLIKDYDAFFSFSATVVNAPGKRLIDCVKEVPLDKILIESDEESPLIILDVIKKIAEIKSVPIKKITEIIYENSKRVLKNGQIT